MKEKISEQRLLDVTELPPPQPIERVLDALVDLPEGDSLRVRFPMEPVMLYPMLRDMGMSWERVESAAGVVELLIREKPAPGLD